MNAISKTIAVVALFGVSQALLVSPAAAKTVTLSCRTEQGPATYTLRIDYSSGLVEEINDSGSAYTGAATANISDNAIVWSTDYPSSYLSGDNVRHALRPIGRVV